MRSKIIYAYQKALDNYINRAERGYKMGLFSYFRHSFSKTPKIAYLESQLITSLNDEDALTIIINHLLSKSATFNNHSFNSYLIDALKESLPAIDWNCFTPNAIKKYRGVIYRGTSQPPEKLFNVGIQELEFSDKIEDYLKFRNGSVGISTSKDFECALEYANNSNRSGRQRYIYSINYRGNEGYDVLETGKARGLSFHSLFHRNRFSGWKKREVNIKTSIDNTDIIGAWSISKGLLTWIDNPNYQLNKNTNGVVAKMGSYQV
ncbi:hypothetical protein ACNVED_16280 (plasmid) [Legionella sp. D16C41]|uniref:hypothetical protein n=1 Tax=Legionella sp. D16C41 TaxID=3402688 RepID=UPI003AF94DB3